MDKLNVNSDDRFILLDDNFKWGINGQKKSNEEIEEIFENKIKENQKKSLDKYMIIGSVVGIINNYDKLMIIGYKGKDSSGIERDYIACKYPYGITSQIIYFNHEDIKRIYYIGFTTEYGNEFKSNLDDDKKKGMIR